MKLTSELIFDRLSKLFEAEYLISCDNSTVVGRPVFYDADRHSAGHICIIPPDTVVTQALDAGVYISIGNTASVFPTHDIERIIVPGHLSPNALLNALQDIFDYYDSWESKLSSIIESDAGYSELIQCATGYLGCPISLVDDDFTIIAISDNSSEGFRDEIDHDKISSSIMNELISDPLFSKGLHNTDIFEFNIGGEVFLSYNFKKDGKYIGRVSLNLKEEHSKESYKYLFRFLIQKIEVMLKKFGSFLLHKQTLTSLRDILTSCLKNAPPDRQYMEFRLSENGWSNNDSYMLIRLQPEFRHEWQLHATYLIPLIERQWPSACAVEYEQYVLILMNLNVYSPKSRQVFMQELAYFLRDSLMLAGISRVFSGIDQLAAFYRQTELAVTLGRDTDPMCWYYCFDNYALHCWIRYGVLNFSPEQICSKILLDLIAYDKNNSTEFYKTLRAFYSNKFSFTHAADELYIHRTTLIKRVERIVELTNLNLDNPDENLYNELSFRFIDKVKPVN